MIDTLFNTLWDTMSDRRSPMNVTKSDAGWTLEFRAAGIKKEDISIDAEDNILIIKGSTKTERPEESVHDRIEFWPDTINKRVSMPVEADMENISAKLSDGILKVSVGKKVSKSKSKVEIL